MNKIKKLILIFFSAILTLETSGCIFNKEPSTKELALQYLSSKYNDNFTLCGYLSKSWAYSYETITYYSEKYSDKVIVYVYGDKGDYSYKDNYYMLSMKDDAQNYFEKFPQKYGYSVETKARFLFSDSYYVDGNDSFPDYLKSGNCKIEIYYICQSDLLENDSKTILKDIYNSNSKIKLGFIYFIVTNDKDLLSQYTIDEIVNDKRDNILREWNYTINNKYGFEES